MNLPGCPIWTRRISTLSRSSFWRPVRSRRSPRHIRVSYPTVRLRLDRLIQKIQITERAEEDAFIGLVKRMAMDEKLELDTAKTIIRAYRDTKGED